MRALLLPIKDLREAKQRLAPLLSPEERFALAQAMLADTIRAVRGVRRADRIFVVTNYLPAMQAAEENGWELLREERQVSEDRKSTPSELQSPDHLVCRLLLEKKKTAFKGTAPAKHSRQALSANLPLSTPS